MGAAAALLWRRRLAMSSDAAPQELLGSLSGSHGWEQRPAVRKIDGGPLP
jgi:hypothetical protein